MPVVITRNQPGGMDTFVFNETFIALFAVR